MIGKHGIFDQWYFHGDLSELVIFNTALRPAEVKELSRQLMDHYTISSRKRRDLAVERRPAARPKPSMRQTAVPLMIMASLRDECQFGRGGFQAFVYLT